MSAYVNDGKSQIIPFLGANTGGGSIQSDRHEEPTENIISAFYRLEKFVHASRNLEENLLQEKKKNKKLQEELHQTQSTYDLLLSEAKAKNRELEINEKFLRDQLSNQTGMEKRFQAQMQWATEKLKTIRAELFQYKAVWSEVLQREKEAKLIIAEGRKLDAHSIDLEKRCEKLQNQLENEKTARASAERQTESYQAELKAALVRSHSNEARISELTHELQRLNNTKQDFNDKVQQTEHSIQERFQWALKKERENIRAEFERETAIEQESFREKIKKTVRAELESDMILDRDRLLSSNKKLMIELERLRLSR